MRRKKNPLVLMTACKSGTLPTAQQAVADGADLNYVDDNGWTPAMLAIDNHHNKVTDWILSQDSVNMNNGKTSKGNTTLHIACAESDCEEIVTKVAKLSENVNILNNEDKTPAQHAIEKRNGIGILGLVGVPAVDWEVKDKDMAR